MSGSAPLPDSFTAARRSDEPFWQRQERRIQGSTGQPCCTLSGISTGLIAMEGDFAVVIHGEDECAACFLHYGPSSHRFFCTGLTEKHFVTGQTAEPLRRCLRLLCEEVHPSAILVLGACPIEVIGDRFEEVVEDVADEYPHVPMRALHTSGLKVGSQAAMTDWMFSTLVGLPLRPPVDPRWRRQVGDAGFDMVEAFITLSPEELLAAHKQASALLRPPPLEPSRCINFIGMPAAVDLGGFVPEWTALLERIGVIVTGDFPGAATLDDWRGITHAAATFVVDRSLYPRTVQTLEDGGQTVVDIDLPVGIGPTERFYETIGTVLGLEDEVTAVIAEAKAAAEAIAADFASERGGLRVAMGLRQLNNYRPDQLAQHGLGDYAALSELGFDITLMVQGPPEKRDKFARLFALRGITTPFEVFPEPWSLSKHLGGGRFDVAYMADHCRGEARKAGVPLMVSRMLCPGFAGVARNARVIRQQLEQEVRR